MGRSSENGLRHNRVCRKLSFMMRSFARFSALELWGGLQ